MDPRDYTDRESLQCLVELIGPTSVESICATIANLIVAQTLKLRSSLEAEYTALAAIDAVLVSGSDLAQVVSQLRSLDDLAAQLIQIGAAIFLLQLLHGHCSSAAKDAWEVRVAPRIVRELQQDTDRRATWTRLLPAACAAAFHANVWKRTRYLSSVEATDTNAHMMGLAMAHLLPAPHSSSAVQRCAVAALARASKYKDGAAQTSSRSKRSFQLELTGSESSARPLLEALELLVTTAASSGGAIETINSAPPDLELALERILPRAVLALYSTA
ncbi:hypothetical protein PHYBOEH_000701 [Phytophthora boehmeriae]|uniref:Uncharacterized protein n=1 Tax=Phytophthora boehmeriae TaxID=109152 RepID=A0A8T1WWE7_9STRA|nr:hypothetical protein PHYBOEH_000701 [Phytophthora boehmeriae]